MSVTGVETYMNMFCDCLSKTIVISFYMIRPLETLDSEKDH